MNRETTAQFMNRLVREQRENPDVLRERLEQDFARILGVPPIAADIARPRSPVDQGDGE